MSRSVPASNQKTALVTGGARGIGYSIALHLLQTGYRVILADCAVPAGMAAVRRLRTKGVVTFHPTDVADETAVDRLFDGWIRRYQRLDLLVNNAGIGGFGKPVEKLSPAEWNRTLGVNLTGAFLCTRRAVPLLRKTRGVIVNIASTRALQSEPNSEAYAASKGGLVALTHALAISLGPAIRVHAISPGWIDVRPPVQRTKLRSADHLQQPVGRVGKPADIAELVLFLADSRAGFITGQNFVVDGGMTRKMIYLD
jgi:NAD(P)-dependent dehydrogenase (short-subunit alcohol dehydrogenase family)